MIGKNFLAQRRRGREAEAQRAYPIPRRGWKPHLRDDFVKMAASYNAPFRYAAIAVQNAAGDDPAKARRERKKEIRERKAAAGE